MRAVIPHHSGAILMYEEASIRNPKIQELCKGIVSGQRTQIDQMRSILRELNGGE